MTIYEWLNYDQYKTDNHLNKQYYGAVNWCYGQSLRSIYNGRWDFCLDIGCGSGDSTLVLAEFASNVTGVDSSSYLIDRARERTYPANASFIHDTFDHVDLPSDHFANVSASWIWNHYHSVESLKGAFAKIRTILKTDGTISFVVPSDSFTSSRIQKIALQEYGWKLAWIYENSECTKGFFTYGEEFIETTVWQPFTLMKILSEWFDVEAFDTKGELIRECLLPNLAAEPPFAIIYGKVKGDR